MNEMHIPLRASEFNLPGVITRLSMELFVLVKERVKATTVSPVP